MCYINYGEIMYSNEIVCQILDYIDQNITTKISLIDISNYFFFNKFYISKLFKREIKTTITTYINTLKIINSLSNINNKHSITSVSIRNGFQSLEYFSETFSKIIGVSPSIYQNFYHHRKINSEKQIMTLQQNIINAQKLKKMAIDYRKNRKVTKIPNKKLSIFKN